MSAANNAAEVSAGRVSACMRLGTGHVYCWGNDPPAGIGTAGAPARVPAEVAGIVDAIQISTGHEHACVLHATGVVSCWGSDQYNQLGDGKGLDSVMPVDVSSLTGHATSIAAGIVHSCARVLSGAIFCWGQDILQQLGDGSTSVKLSPVAVVGF
jgi:alpha-tubulin suppressor-like RCC1 family protein